MLEDLLSAFHSESNSSEKEIKQLNPIQIEVLATIGNTSLIEFPNGLYGTVPDEYLSAITSEEDEKLSDEADKEPVSIPGVYKLWNDNRAASIVSNDVMRLDEGRYLCRLENIVCQNAVKLPDSMVEALKIYSEMKEVLFKKLREF